jgi:hypothetical protein
MSPWQNKHSARTRYIHQQIGFQFKEKTSKILHLERSVLWCWNLNTLRSRSEISCKVWNVVMEKDGLDQVDWSGEKRNSSNLIDYIPLCYNSIEEYYVESRRRGISYMQWKRRKFNWIDHFLRRNCLLKHVIEGKIEGRLIVTERWRRGRKQLLDDIKEKRRYESKKKH